MNRVLGDDEKRMLFRGWSRICVHAAAVSVAEGILVSSPNAPGAVGIEKMAAVNEEVESCGKEFPTTAPGTAAGVDVTKGASEQWTLTTEQTLRERRGRSVISVVRHPKHTHSPERVYGRETKEL